MHLFLAGLLGLFAASGVACGDNRIAGGSLDGARIYKEACARCHGEVGVPLPGLRNRVGVKSLVSEHVVSMSDADIVAQIRMGSKNRMMPSFQGVLGDDQMKALVAHIRLLVEFEER